MKKNNKRLDFLSLIPAGVRRVLDVGCGDGTWGAQLRSQGKEVSGIEKDPALCVKARARLDRVFEADSEQLTLPVAQGYFDCILYADVLEHLMRPLETLKSHQAYLADNGFILASIPNIRYYKVINELVFKGVWDYMPTGILDASHVRFFTLTTMRELFEEAGFEIIDIKRHQVSSRIMRALNILVCNAARDFLTYQYYIVARKSNAAHRASKRTKSRF